MVAFPCMFRVDPKSRNAWTIGICAPIGNKSLRLSHFLKGWWPPKSSDLSLEILAPMSWRWTRVAFEAILEVASALGPVVMKRRSSANARGFADNCFMWTIHGRKMMATKAIEKGHP